MDLLKIQIDPGFAMAREPADVSKKLLFSSLYGTLVKFGKRCGLSEGRDAIRITVVVGGSGSSRAGSGGKSNVGRMLRGGSGDRSTRHPRIFVSVRGSLMRATLYAGAGRIVTEGGVRNAGDGGGSLNGVKERMRGRRRPRRRRARFIVQTGRHAVSSDHKAHAYMRPKPSELQGGE